MKERDKDLPEDERLRDVLQQWEVERPPQRLDARVVESYRAASDRGGWWRRLLTGAVPIPLPAAVVLAALLVVAGYIAGRSASAVQPQPARTAPIPAAPMRETQTAGLPLVTMTPLAGFQPIGEVRFKLLPKEVNQ